MDLRTYYKKVREAEADLTGEHFVMVSLATSEGGKEGVRDRSAAVDCGAADRGRARARRERRGSAASSAKRIAWRASSISRKKPRNGCR